MLSFFPLDVLDEIWDVIESVSEGFLTYSSILSASSFSYDSALKNRFCFSILSCDEVKPFWFPLLDHGLCFAMVANAWIFCDNPH